MAELGESTGLYDRGMMPGMGSVDARCSALATTASIVHGRVKSATEAERRVFIDTLNALANDAVGDPLGADDVTAVLILSGWLALALDECEQAGAGAALDVLARVQARLGSMS